MLAIVFVVTLMASQLCAYPIVNADKTNDVQILLAALAKLQTVQDRASQQGWPWGAGCPKSTPCNKMSPSRMQKLQEIETKKALTDLLATVLD